MKRSYRIHSLIGDNVYSAFHLASARSAVIVVGNAGDGLEDRAVQLARLDHPGIAPMIEHGVFPSLRPWISTVLPEGTAVDDIVERGAMSVIEVADLVHRLAEVLAHAHERGVAHGGLTLRTVFRATGAFPYAIANWSLVNDRLGAYPAPEGLARDARGDIYALGVIACRALTRSFPVAGAMPETPGVPAGLAVLIARMLTPDPARRPTAAMVRELAAELVAHPDAAAVTSMDLAYLKEKTLQLAHARIRKPKWTPALGTPLDHRWRKVSIVFTNARAPHEPDSKD